MVSTVKSRPNHYEVLGLKPSASSDEIAAAFGREFSMFRPRTFGGIADVTVAYETLRDPARRRAYDDSLGLNAEPKPRPSPVAWQTGGHFVAASAIPMKRQAAPPPEPKVKPQPRPEAQMKPQPRPEAQMKPQPRPEAPAEPELPSFIANALRELAEPGVLNGSAAPAARPEPPRRPEPAAMPRINPEARRPAPPAPDDLPDEGEDRPVQWKKIGTAAGALVLAVGLLGGWAGWRAGAGAEPQQGERTAMLAPPTTFTIAKDPPSLPARVLDEVRPAQPKRSAHVATRAARARPASHLADLEQQLAEPKTVQADAIEQPAEAAPATAVAASMPLPNRVIARTIKRIGYPCGEVASTTAGGAPGVFTVTCTSGHSYQAAPVRGRYHFRRVAGR